MAKDTKGAGKAGKNDKAKAADTKAKDSDFKYGVSDLADVLDIEPASARVALRKHEVPKLNGNSYGWKTKDDLQKVADKLRSTPAEKPKAKVKAAGTEKSKSTEAKKPIPKKKAA